ncbi:MAG: recombinase family protein, partial [Fimbriimonadaceae bacterium]|nr:recombinase family protein [Fimbriimonadaceae bacterium]
EFISPGEKGFTRKSLDILLKTAHDHMHARSDRIKRAMVRAAKRNGEKYGSARPGHWTRKNNHLRGWKVASETAVRKRSQRCADAYGPIIPEIEALLKKGESYASIANTLNEAGHLTLTGSPFSAATVFKIYKRLGAQHGKDTRKVGRKAALAAAH